MSTIFESLKKPASMRGVALALIIGAGAAWVKHHYFKPITMSTPVAHSVEVGSFLMELRGNQAAAHQKYQGKVIEVAGKMRGVRMQGSTPVLSIGYMLIFNIECHLAADRTPYAARLEYGADMRVRGVVRLNGSDVHLDPCIY